MEKIISNKKCLKCEACSFEFDILSNDILYYKKFSPCFNNKTYLFPEPSLCPSCRELRRLCFRNERKLYKRTSSLSGKDIVSIFSPDKLVPVYEQSEWWSDRWDELDYGFDFDFTKSYFPQYQKLLKTVPQQNIIGANNENSSYCNLTADNKNCYLISESSNNEDSYYGYWLQKSKNCVDTGFMHLCENCYWSESCTNCFNSSYIFNCRDCSFSSYLEDCIGCENCFLCVNLSNKKYHIYNKQYTKEDYDVEISKLSNDKHLLEKFIEFKVKLPKKASRILNSDNCSGDQIVDSKNCSHCYHAHDAEDCRYAEHVWRNAKNCMDVSTAGRDAENIYESINCGISDYNLSFCVQCRDGCHDLLYCSNCINSNNSFGCVGLRNKSYCIFNKQYSKKDYYTQVEKIINYIKETGEWGEFFPSNLSPFGYNETTAYDLNELDKKSALEQGYNWSDYVSPIHKIEKTIKADLLPESIDEIPDDILNWAILCVKTDKPFKILKEELDFYRKHKICIPKHHPEERYKQRVNLRVGKELYDRNCDKCQIDIKTNYTSGGKDIVYCQKCYRSEVR